MSIEQAGDIPNNMASKSDDFENFCNEIGNLQQLPPEETAARPHLQEVDLNDLTTADMELYWEYQELERNNFPAVAVRVFEEKLEAVASREEHADSHNPDHEKILQHPKENFLAYIRTLLVEKAGELRHQEREALKEKH